MKILVTGGAGFIGSHLCKSLLENENEVICLDNLYTGSKKNISKLLVNPLFKFIEHDICNPIDIKVDQIYNLACPASPLHYQKNPIYTIKTNFIGIFNILENAEKHNAKVLQASTSEVYGDPLVSPQKETYWGNVNPIGVRSCYDEGKRIAETLCSDHYAQKKMDIKIARIFNTYGTNMQKNDGRVVSNFIIQALLNKDITVYGDGTQTRSFCYVSDLVEGLIGLMSEKNNNVNPVNLGNPNEYSITELAELIIKLTNSNSKIVYQKLPEDDPKIRRPDISNAVNRLNWKPKIEIVEGLSKVEEYFRSII